MKRLRAGNAALTDHGRTVPEYGRLAFDNGVASLLVRIRNNSEHKSAVVYAPRSMEPDGVLVTPSMARGASTRARPPPFPEGAASAGVQSNPEFTVVPMYTMPTTTPPRESR